MFQRGYFLSFLPPPFSSCQVPKLEHWYRENANPSRQKLQHYLIQLNAMNYRRHNPKVTYQQICNWFSNARASRKRNHRMPIGKFWKCLIYPINFGLITIF